MTIKTQPSCWNGWRRITHCGIRNRSYKGEFCFTSAAAHMIVCHLCSLFHIYVSAQIIWSVTVYTLSFKVPAIQQRKIVAFLNQFIVHTVRFLNRFSTVCEEVCSPVSTSSPSVTQLIHFLKMSMTWWIFFIIFFYTETRNRITTNPADWNHTKHFGSKGKSTNKKKIRIRLK